MKSLREIGKIHELISKKVAAIKMWTLSGRGDQAAKIQGRVEDKKLSREALIG
jgi:hypothetical protein